MLKGHQRIFGSKLAGFYLYGSLIWGDFDTVSSDIDTLCAITSEITQEEIALLQVMYEDIFKANPSWRGRIEVHYASLHGLRHFREFSSKMGNISPGEPLHIIDAGAEWVDEWYCVQEYAITLFGMDKSKVIPYIEKSEFIGQVCQYVRSFNERIKENENNRYGQAYIILTLCRGLYTLKNGEQISKLGAARWASDFLPEYQKLISDALIWRSERQFFTGNSHETYLQTEKFIEDVIERFF